MMTIELPSLRSRARPVGESGSLDLGRTSGWIVHTYMKLPDDFGVLYAIPPIIEGLPTLRWHWVATLDEIWQYFWTNPHPDVDLELVLRDLGIDVLGLLGE